MDTTITYDEYIKILPSHLLSEFQQQTFPQLLAFIEAHGLTESIERQALSGKQEKKKKNTTAAKRSITLHRNRIKELESALVTINKEIERYETGEKSIERMTQIYQYLNDRARENAFSERTKELNDLIRERNRATSSIDSYTTKIAKLKRVLE